MELPDYSHYPTKTERWESQHKPRQLTWWAWLAVGVGALALMSQVVHPPSQAAPAVQQLPPCQISQQDAVRLTGHFQEGCR